MLGQPKRYNGWVEWSSEPGFKAVAQRQASRWNLIVYPYLGTAACDGRQGGDAFHTTFWAQLDQQGAGSIVSLVSLGAWLKGEGVAGSRGDSRGTMAVDRKWKGRQITETDRVDVWGNLGIGIG